MRGRRFERVGKKERSPVIDDYAHNPTEVRATLKALKEEYPDRRRIVIFQPHLYSRTKYFLHDFAESFNEADYVFSTSYLCCARGV